MKLLLIGILLLGIPALEHAQETQVLQVVEGDTIKVMYEVVEKSVRLISVDTPERGQLGSSDSTAHGVSDLGWPDLEALV